MRYLLYLVALLAFALPSKVNAIGFLPTSTDILVMPGEEGIATFEVVNTDVVPREFAASLYGVQFNALTDEPEFRSLSSAISGWASLSAYDFSLQSGEAKTLTLMVSPPVDTSADSFVVSVVARELAKDTNGTSVTSGVSSLVFVTVGQPEVSANIQNFSVSSKISSGIPLTFAGTIVNTGERVVQPFGVVTIYNTFGGKAGEYDLNPKMRRIPAGLAKTYSVSWGEAVTGGIMTELWRELVDFKIGVFTAELSAAPYPGGEVTLMDKVRVVVVPWRVLAICGVLFAVGFFVRRRRRR